MNHFLLSQRGEQASTLDARPCPVLGLIAQFQGLVEPPRLSPGLASASRLREQTVHPPSEAHPCGRPCLSDIVAEETPGCDYWAVLTDSLRHYQEMPQP